MKGLEIKWMTRWEIKFVGGIFTLCLLMAFFFLFCILFFEGGRLSQTSWRANDLTDVFNHNDYFNKKKVKTISLISKEPSAEFQCCLQTHLPWFNFLGAIFWPFSRLWVHLSPTNFWADVFAGHVFISKSRKHNASFICCTKLPRSTVPFHCTSSKDLEH